VEAKMTELSPKAQALLWDAIVADMPSDSDRARVRGKLVAQLGAGALVSSAAIAASAANAATIGTVAGSTAHGASAMTATTTAASHAGLSAVGTTAATATLNSGGLGIVAKTAIAAVLAGAVGIGANMAIRNTTQSSPAVLPQQPSSESEHSAPLPAVRERVEERQIVTSEKIEKPVPIVEPRSHPQRQFTLERKQGTAKSRPTLDAELELLRAAQLAMRQGDARSALDTLESHAQRFPRGALSQERDATRAIALCELNRLDEGRLVAQRLLAKSPRSPLAERIYRSCGALDK
jgi:hypothetical protein